MKKLFENLDNIEYTFGNKQYTIKDTFGLEKNYKNIETYINNSNYYFIHEVKDGEKWESISKNYYGNSELKMFWIFIILNEIEDLFYQFALNIDELGKATGYTEEQNIITQTLFETSIDYNDNKRFIKILKKEYINDFETTFFKKEN
jgi:hypothetical protein